MNHDPDIHQTTATITGGIEHHRGRQGQGQGEVPMTNDSSALPDLLPYTPGKTVRK